MIEEQTLIKFIAVTLKVDEIYVSRETNITTLCVISLYLNDLDSSIRNKLQINVPTLNKKIDKEKRNGRDIEIDITDCFVNPSEKPIIYYDRVGFDGFREYIVTEDVLILQIEQLLHFPHTDDEIIEAHFDIIGDLINFYCEKENPYK